MVTLELFLEGILLFSVSIFGLCGNIATISVLTSPDIDLKVTFRQIVTMLSVYDSIFIIMINLTFSFIHLIPFWEQMVTPFLYPFTFPTMQVALSGSIWSTVMVALERYLSVVHQYQM